jgi:membrane fusion protein (multidrug efflux system)
MIKRMILMLIVVALVIGGVFGYKTFKGIMFKKYMASMGSPTQTVSSTKAAPMDWQPHLDAVGTVHAINGADLSSEIAGIVESIDFESGSDAKEGQVLAHLRAEDDIAKLHSLEATAKLAQITVDRDQKQLKSQAISQAVVDADIANMSNITAQVAEQQAIIDKKIIRAPFDGRLGIRQINLGQYLNPGATIVTLQQLDPIYIDFTLPEQALAQIKVGDKVTAKTDTSPDAAFEGQITSINSKVDETTRNIQVRATFKNGEGKLLPGIFANVAIDVGGMQHYLTLPQTAIVYNTYGNTVYLVDHGDDSDSSKPKLTAKQSVVVTGETRGDQVAIISGVKEGDEVVTSGQIKLRSGAPIAINNDVPPLNDANPSPHEQ